MTNNAQMNPWSTGTPAYRAALLIGMGATFGGILALISAALTDISPLRTTGMILIGAGILSHVVGIGLRKRQATQIIRDRQSAAGSE